MCSLTSFSCRSALRVLAVTALLLSLSACDSSESGDASPLSIVSATSDGAAVSVVFSSELNPTSVTASAFSITPGATVASANGSGAMVTLALAAPLDGSESRSYTVTANGIRDRNGNVGNGLTATFSYGQGSSGSSTAIGAAYPNAGDNRLVFINTSGSRYLTFNPVTGASTNSSPISNIENGLIPLNAVGATANLPNAGTTYFFGTDGDTFTRYRRNDATFSSTDSFEDVFYDDGYRLNSIGAAVEGYNFNANSIVLFNQNGTQWQLYQPNQNNPFSQVLTFPGQFGGGNAPISAVGAAVYRTDTNQMFLFSRDGTRYTIWSGGSNFSAAFPVEELGSYSF